MLYEKLNPEMKRMVDDYARRLKVYDWGRRSELLAEVSLPFGEDIDEALAVESKGHCPTYLRAFKWRRIPVHDQVGALVRRRYLTHRVGCLLSYVLH